MQDNEAEWLLNAQNGDQQAFSYLVEKYQRPVYNLSFRMLGNAQDAEDAAQEAFLRAYKAMKRYDNNRAFSSWLLSITAHYCIDQIRKKKFTVVSVEELSMPNLPDNTPGVETKLSKKDEQLRIRELLEELSPIDRAAVIFYYWYDFSYQEISETLSLSISAVKSRLHRARRTMANRWAEKNKQTLNAERILV